MSEFIEKRNANSCYAILLAGLLHDIGTFIQRAGDYSPPRLHAQLSEEWYQINLRAKFAAVFGEDDLARIQSLIRDHHSDAEYISLADAIATGATRISIEDEEEKHPCSPRLLSIFSRISLSDKPKKPGYHRLAHLGQEDLKETFPIENAECSAKEYASLLSDFERETADLNFAGTKPDQVVDRLTFLLWKYCWCVPSGNYRAEPDVSLYDHLRITASLAGCLHGFHRENPNKVLSLETRAFCLIAGDISGIQSYIFSILPQQGKIAKRLRARSLFVQLLSEVAAHRILHDFELPLCNSMMSAGGNFYVLVPNLKDAEERIKRIQEEFDRWTLEHLNAELSVNLAGLEVTGEELTDFPELVGRLKRKLNEAKYGPHRSVLSSAGGWSEDVFLRPRAIEQEEEVCESCRRYKRYKAVEVIEEALCERCYTDAEIGKRLPASAYIAFFKENFHPKHVSHSSDGSHRFEILGYSFELWPRLQSTTSTERYLLLALNREEVVPPSTGFKHLALHIPTEQHPRTEEDTARAIKEEANQALTFDAIADAAQGDKLLGYVKADVDNMGRILREGLKGGHSVSRYEGKLSISRFVMLSRMLETFFSGYLQTTLEEKFKELYTVFSGGDDFFVVGPWNIAIRFARHMRNEFSRYCSNNDDLTFSAGIFLAQPHEPIAFCAEAAEAELKKSKKQEKKDKVTLFGQTVNWNELDTILAEADKVIKWLDTEPPIISRSFAYNLQRYAEMAEKSGIYANIEEKSTKYLRFVPLLVYDINRNLTKDAQQDARQWASALLPTVEKPQGGDNLPYLKVIMEYVLAFARAET